MKNFRLLRILPVLLGVLMLAACSANDPESTVKDFYQAVAAGEVEDAVEMVDFRKVRKEHLEDFSTAKLKEEFLEKKTSMEKRGGLSSIEIVSVKLKDEDHARVESTLHFDNGDKKSARDRLVRVDGEWMLSVL